MFSLWKQFSKPIARIIQTGKPSSVYLCHPWTVTTVLSAGPTCHYGIKPKQMNYSDENSLSSKILQHMRFKPEDAGFQALVGADANENLHNTHTRHQMLLVLAHSPHLNASDIIKTFSLYTSSEQSIVKDLIAKASLMNDVRAKVEQFLPSMTLPELRDIALILKKLQFRKSTYTMKLVSAIDSDCERRALQANFHECMELFDILLSLHGNHISRKAQFDTFMLLFEKHIQLAKPVDLVHILYYVGLGKKSKLCKEFIMSVVRKLEDHLEDLSFMDLGIAASGIYKTCVKLDTSSPFVMKMVDQLNTTFRNCLELSELEKYSLVSMIKLIRSSRYEDDNFLKTVSAFVMQSDVQMLEPEVVVHILALYTNMSVYHKDVFEKLENFFYHHLSSSSQVVRLKDLSRILWCFSHVRHGCSSEFLEVCDKSMTDFLHKSGFRSYPEFLAGCLLSMAIMGHYPQHLIKEAFHPQKLASLRTGYQRNKPLSRLMMLYQAVSVERPEINIVPPPITKSDLPARTLTDEVQYRPTLATLMEGAQVINEMLEVSVFKLIFPVANFNFASLAINAAVVKKVTTTDSESVSRSHIVQQLLSLYEHNCENKVAVELYDSNCTVQNTVVPIGMVDMKTRLMNKSGWSVKMVTEDELLKCDGDAQAVAALILAALDKKSL